jgi:hypothetical protein
VRPAALVLLVACGRPPVAAAPAPAPAPAALTLPARAGVHRIVTYSFFQSSSGRDDTQHCTMVKLDETVAHADGDRELAIDANIVDGDAPECGVGTLLRIAIDNHQVTVGASGDLPWWTRDHIRALHEHLGEVNGAFTLATKLPLGAKQAATGDYLDLTSEDSSESHGMSDSNTHTTVTARVRASDHALACARYFSETRGAGEYGGFSGSLQLAVEIDYGDGAPHCRY